MARTYAAETATTPIRVNLFNPGPTRTSMRAAVMPGEDPMTLPTPKRWPSTSWRSACRVLRKPGGSTTSAYKKLMTYRAPE